MSATTILGAPAEMYTAGTLYFLYTIGLIFACVLTARLLVPLFYPLRLTSSYEYLELRFQSKAVKFTGTIIMIVTMLLYSGITTYAPSTALETVTGFPTWATIISVGFVSTLYTFLGGMKAVIWTDFFQAIVMVIGLLAIVIQGFAEVGGFNEVWKINKEWDRIEFWKWDPNPAVRHSSWSLIVGGGILWIAAFGGQPSVQRFSALPTLRKAKLSIYLNIVGCILLMLLTCLAGIAMFAYYAKKGCDPLTDGQVKNPNQLLPYFVMEILGYPGLPGLFVSCLFSGALSTMSSNLNSVSAVIWEDIIKPHVSSNISESKKAWITRSLVVIFGAASVGVSFMVQNFGGTVLQISLSFTGAAVGPLVGMFFLGGLFPWANAIGSVIGGISGLGLALWIGFGSYSLPRTGGLGLSFPRSNCTVIEDVLSTLNSTTTTSSPSPVVTTDVELTALQHMYTVSYLYFPAIGMLTTIVVGLLISLITAPCYRKIEVDPKYLIPFFDRLYCCLPERWRRPCRFGYDFLDPEELTRRTDEERELKNDNQQKTANKGDNEVNTKQAKVFASNGIASLSYRHLQPNQNFVYENSGYQVESVSQK
ncbi:Sodium-coupled monocarboxylate transporter 1 [Mactra antiquata]